MKKNSFDRAYQAFENSLRNKATVKSFTNLFWFYDRVVVSTGNPNKEAKWIMYVTVMKEEKLSAIVQ